MNCPRCNNKWISNSLRCNHCKFYSNTYYEYYSIEGYRVYIYKANMGNIANNTIIYSLEKNSVNIRRALLIFKTNSSSYNLTKNKIESILVLK